ncbi:MAG: tRNA (guanosine(46)-N7)-methyltransferase TrmB [Opitutales bacterium]
MSDESTVVTESNQNDAKTRRLPPELREAIALRQVQLRVQLNQVLQESKGKSWSLEVGCGHGHYLVDYAEANPKTFCLGIDLVTKRIERAQAKVQKRGLHNVSFLKAELFEFFELLPRQVTFEAIFMLFPDPWPKKRHARRRMLQAVFLDAIAARMPVGAPFYFQTDHSENWEWAMEQLETHAAWVLLPQARVEAEWPLRTVSYFEELCGEGQRAIAVRL